MTENQTKDVGSILLAVAEYIQPTPHPDLDQVVQIDSQLEEITRAGFGVEQLPKQALIKQRVELTYSQISPSFLRQTSQKPIQGRVLSVLGQKIPYTIPVPNFGVYSLDNPIMSISFGESPKHIRGPFFFEVNRPRNLPYILGKEFVQGNELFLDGYYNYFWGEGTSAQFCFRGSLWLGTGLPETAKKQLKKKYIHGFWDTEYANFTITSGFNGIIPAGIRSKIEEAKKFFGDQVFLVAETKPEDWQVSKYIPRLVQDPLLIGVLEDKCYYIGSFNTTPLERFASREFTID